MNEIVLACCGAASVYLGFPVRVVRSNKHSIFDIENTLRAHPLRRAGMTQKKFNSQVTQDISLMAITVSSGQTLRRALTMHQPRSLRPAVVAACEGHSLRDAFEKLAHDWHCPELAALGIAVVFSEQSGAALSPALEAATEQLRHRESRMRLMTSEIAGTRATVVVLAALPLVGMAMSTAAGGDSLSWLIGGLPGRLCLAAGIALEIFGLLWVKILIRRVST